jgi:hypothetical protein
MPGCFGNDERYLDGEWRASEASMPYRLQTGELFAWQRDNDTYAGICHESRATNAAPPELLSWHPRSCTYSVRSRDAACAALRGASLLFIGDSIMEQQFISASHVLGADFSSSSTRWIEKRWIKRNESRLAQDEGRMEARACGGDVRVGYVRSDLLFWSASRRDIVASTQFRRNPAVYDFRASAAEADVVVLGGGQHFTNALKPFSGRVRSIWDAREKLGRDGLDWTTVFRAVLNHTITRLLAVRRAAGRHDASTILLSTTRPVPRCYLYDRPLRHPVDGNGDEFMLRLGAQQQEVGGGGGGPQQQGGSHGHGGRKVKETFFAPQYRDFGRYRAVARSMATALSISFLDIHPSAALRPDAARARYIGRRWTYNLHRLANGSTVRERGGQRPMDCVHMCLPGPPDSWSYLIFNLILERVPSPLTSPATGRSASPSPTAAATGHFVQRELRRGEFLPRLPSSLLYDVPSDSSEWWWPYKHAPVARAVRRSPLVVGARSGGLSGGASTTARRGTQG